jgi:hypothetical protein
MKISTQEIRLLNCRKCSAAYAVDKPPKRHPGLSDVPKYPKGSVSSHVLATSKPRRRWWQPLHKADVNILVKLSNHQSNWRILKQDLVCES